MGSLCHWINPVFIGRELYLSRTFLTRGWKCQKKRVRKEKQAGERGDVQWTVNMISPKTKLSKREKWRVRDFPLLPFFKPDQKETWTHKYRNDDGRFAVHSEQFLSVFLIHPSSLLSRGPVRSLLFFFSPPLFLESLSRSPETAIYFWPQRKHVFFESSRRQLDSTIPFQFLPEDVLEFSNLGLGRGETGPFCGRVARDKLIVTQYLISRDRFPVGRPSTLVSHRGFPLFPHFPKCLRCSPPLLAFPVLRAEKTLFPFSATFVHLQSPYYIPNFVSAICLLLPRHGSHDVSLARRIDSTSRTYSDASLKAHFSLHIEFLRFQYAAKKSSMI